MLTLLVTPSSQPKANSGAGVGLLLGEQVRAHPLELGEHLVVDRVVDDAGLLGRADHRGVERLGDQDVDDRAADVGGAVEVDGGVAGADADSPGLPAALASATIFGPPVTQMKSTSGCLKR